MRVTVSPEQIQSAFEAVKDDPSFDESRGLWERGRPPVEMIQAMCLRPEILRGFAGFGNSVYPGGLLERRVKELVIITASKTNECQFCTYSHCDLVDIAGHRERPARRDRAHRLAGPARAHRDRVHPRRDGGFQRHPGDRWRSSSTSTSATRSWSSSRSSSATSTCSTCSTTACTFATTANTAS